VLTDNLNLFDNQRIFFAGQITGVEGYMESAAIGIMAAYSMLAFLKGKPFTPPLPESAIGALLHYITDEHISVFQPMNINFGIFPTPDVPKKMKRSVLLQREELAFTTWLASIDYL
jgi:methylenetetrahydrofolate--tRNA-(uracil-5-)-methyltransferase